MESGNPFTLDVLASAAAPSGGGAGLARRLGRDRYPGGRCGAVEGAWVSAGRRPATLGSGGRTGHAETRSVGDPGARWLGRWSLGSV